MRASAVLVLLLLWLISGAQAQVSVDMRALDGPGSAPHQVRPTPPPVRHLPQAQAPAPSGTSTATGHTGVDNRATSGTTTSRSEEGQAVQKKSASPAPGAPVHGTAPPLPTVAKAPVPALPTVQPVAPPAYTVVPPPTPGPLPLPPPVQLVFEAGKTDLSPADQAAIQDLARSIPAPAADSVNVVAYAAGKPDDPSTARRLSLSRGLAVRSVLLASGVPSAQIYVRALGATPSNGPADRVELTVAPIGTVTR